MYCYSLFTSPSTKQTPYVFHKLFLKDGAWFQLATCDAYERGNRPVFSFNGKNLYRYEPSTLINSFDISDVSDLAAICFWAGDRRHIAIKLRH
jgi:hypothetical protein